MKQKSLINSLLQVKNKEFEILKNVLLVMSGALFIALFSQLKINLPFSPVPISGGTFGVILISLLYGSKLAPTTVLTYIAAGTFGLPVFANFKSGSLLSPTGGYIIGYFFASIICSYFVSKGYTKSFTKTIFTILLANVAIYTFGLIQLSIFVPNKNVFLIGLVPFIIGDIVKMLAVTSIVTTLTKHTNKN